MFLHASSAVAIATAIGAVPTTTTTLDRRALIARVVETNRDLAAASHAAAGMRRRAEGAGAWPDPVVAYRFSPPSIFDDRVRYGQGVDVQQRIPFFGKLGRRQEAAQAVADAADETTRARRLDLAFEASMVFDELRFVDTARAIFSEHIQLLAALRATAESRFATGQALRQDVLRAESSRLHAEHRLVELQRDRAVLVARLNRLMHQPPTSPLRPAWRSLSLPDDARRETPELARIDAQRRAADARAEEASLDYFPDFSVGGTYSSMWPSVSHRFMVGVAVVVPLSVGRRDAAAETEATEVRRLAAARDAEEERIAYELVAARERVDAARSIVDLYDKRLVAVAKERVATAEAELESGHGTFSGVIDAQRELLSLSLERHRAQVDGSIAAARAWRAVGRWPSLEEQK